MSQYVKVTPEKYIEKLRAGGYDTAAGARRALGKLRYNEKDTKRCRKVLDSIFPKVYRPRSKAENRVVEAAVTSALTGTLLARFVGAVLDEKRRAIVTVLNNTYRQYGNATDEAVDLLRECYGAGLDQQQVSVAFGLEPPTHEKPEYGGGKYHSASPSTETLQQLGWVDFAWQPFAGCVPVSEGCKNCYAARVLYERMRTTRWAKGVVDASGWTGSVKLLYDQLDVPKTGRHPKSILVGDRGDLFQPGIPDEYIRRVMETVDACPQHNFLFLTKHVERMVKLLGTGEVRDNVWLGVSIESRRHLGRLKRLRAASASHRFVSFQPLLSEVRVPEELRSGIDLVVLGAEVGRKKRPCKDSWLTSLVEQFRADACVYVNSVSSGAKFGKHATGAWPLDLRVQERPAGW